MKANEVVFKTETTVEEEIKNLQSKVKDLKRTKSQSNKENAEATKLRAEAIKIKAEAKEILDNIVSAQHNSKDLVLLGKIVVLSSFVLSPHSDSDINTNKVLEDPIDIGLVRLKLVELIQKL